ncbi:MAG: hypothetical protein L6Q73_20030, partial [Aquabacterium sp.]|nr:hypothetical protein [Aquabacterium sp.]
MVMGFAVAGFVYRQAASTSVDAMSASFTSRAAPQSRTGTGRAAKSALQRAIPIRVSLRAAGSLYAAIARASERDRRATFLDYALTGYSLQAALT